MKPDILFFSSNDDPAPVTGALRRFATGKGLLFEPRIKWHSRQNTMDRIRDIEAARLVLVWNGNDPGTRWVQRACETLGKQHLFVEWGLLPQAGYFHMDPSGIVGDSSLCASLSWVSDGHLEAYRSYREAHLGGRGWKYDPGSDSYVLVPLQIEHDSAMYFYSPFLTNQQFVEQAERLYPDQEIVVSPHPKAPRQFVHVTRGRIERKRSTMDLAQNASLVFGMNSTVLLETAMLGAPTVANAPCALFYHRADVERLLAACVARQIPRSATDLTPWLDALEVHL